MKTPLLILILTAQAALAEGGSYFQHQAQGGRIEATPGVSSLSQSTDFGNDVKGKFTQQTTALSLEYGVIPELSFGLEAGQMSARSTFSKTGEDDSHRKISGGTDPEVFVKARTALSVGEIRYGGSVSFATSKKTIEANSDRNASSGGVFVTPFVGYEASFGPHTLGVRTSYRAGVADRQVDDHSFSLNSQTVEVSETESGGDVFTLSVFYEFALEPVTLGLAAQTAQTQAVTTTYDQETSGHTSPDRSVPYKRNSIQLYVPVRATTWLEILPSVEYASYQSSDFSSQKEINGMLQARFAF